MRLEETKPGLFNVTMTTHELSALVAGARMSLSLMQQDPSGSTAAAQEALERVLEDFDRALGRARAAG